MRIEGKGCLNSYKKETNPDYSRLQNNFLFISKETQLRERGPLNKEDGKKREEGKFRKEMKPINTKGSSKRLECFDVTSD